jgi:serine/threonine protein kinase
LDGLLLQDPGLSKSFLDFDYAPFTMQEWTSRHGSKPYPISESKQSLLGKGGFSAAYRIILKKDRSIAAVKVFKLENIGVCFDDAMKEYELLKSLKHKNIVNCLGYCYESDCNRFFLEMELVDGGNLADRIQKKSLEISQVQSLISGIADGLAYIHGQKVIHRDLKPENILLLEKAGKIYPKIADFGLSAQISSSTASKRSSKAGTSAYFSPERGQGDKYNEKADMWAVGCIILELVCKQRLTDPIWSERPAVSEKRESLIVQTEHKCRMLGRQTRKLLSLRSDDRISATELKHNLTEQVTLN